MLRLVLLSLATWRLSSLIHSEDGPWEVFKLLRECVGIMHDEDGEPSGFPVWAEPLDCFWCVTLLVAFVLAPRKPLYWLSASAGAIWLERQQLRSKARW